MTGHLQCWHRCDVKTAHFGDLCLASLVARLSSIEVSAAQTHGTQASESLAGGVLWQRCVVCGLVCYVCTTAQCEVEFHRPAVLSCHGVLSAAFLQSSFRVF